MLRSSTVTIGTELDTSCGERRDERACQQHSSRFAARFAPQPPELPLRAADRRSCRFAPQAGGTSKLSRSQNRPQCLPQSLHISSHKIYYVNFLDRTKRGDTRQAFGLLRYAGAGKLIQSHAKACPKPTPSRSKERREAVRAARYSTNSSSRPMTARFTRLSLAHSCSTSAWNTGLM